MFVKLVVIAQLEEGRQLVIVRLLRPAKRVEAVFDGVVS
jgi:hypothetical protein